MTEEEKKDSNMCKLRQKSSFKRVVLIIVLISLLMCTSIILYLCYFNGGVSMEHNRWGEFGDYLSGISGILNVIAFIGLTVLIHITEKERENFSLQLHAEEVVIKKLQAQIEKFVDLHIMYQQKQSKFVARRTFDFIQPLMTYLFFLKNTKFLPEKTIAVINKTHNYLFEASDTIFMYAYDIDIPEGKQKQMTNVLKVYRDTYRFLEELEVTMVADLGESLGEEASNYEERKDKEQNQQ